ncbi:polysaccharide deacetylase family protein [Aeromicrobium stalagmiti]|uniref:polysaccharide deacetylase family protein n=1 Tax=Aeromicrobium stalagmiti TaxID=2738988 RepID=UPI001569BDC1|nr:polysaccharide deacetylase family protein [Aeromicrobium stalagmiti]
MIRRLLPVVVALIVVASAAPGEAVIPPDVRCRNGTVALTFDDGPSRVNTPRLLRILRKHRAQATFFVTGSNAERQPAVLREMVRDGHAVENHSWDHPDLTTRSSRSVKRQLLLTKAAIRAAIGQNPGYFRPPYGATNKQVRTIGARHGLRQMLWTIDGADWQGGSARTIRRNALSGLRKHRSNVILLHDAVTNSPRTLQAVPSIVKGLRAKGYCLVPLEQMMAKGRVSARSVTATENGAGSRLVRVTFRMNGPSQRDGSFRVRSQDDTAIAGTDYRAVDRVVEIRRGDRAASIHVRVYGDEMPNLDHRFVLRLDRPRSLRLSTYAVPVTITDDGSWSTPTEELIGPVDGSAASLGS